MIVFARFFRAKGLALLLMLVAAPAFGLEPSEARQFVASMAERATTVLSSERSLADRRDRKSVV